MSLAPPTTVQVASGAQHTCALVPSAGVYCWGIGIAAGGSAASVAPTHLATPDFVAVTAGNNFNCGLTAKGQAYCWGANTYGQIGDGTYIDRPEPARVQTPTALIELSASAQTACGISFDHKAYCWGDGQTGGLGDGVDTSHHRSATPRAAKIAVPLYHISVGYGAVCALDSFGSAYCWGAFGQFGRPGTTVDRSAAAASRETTSSCDTAYDALAIHCAVPTRVPGAISFRSLSTGGLVNCGTSADVRAYCFGDGSSGMLGNGTVTESLSPVAVATIDQVQLVSAGPSFMCAVASAAAYCWGNNFRGTLGTGTQNSSAVPVAVAGGLRFVSLSAGTSHACAATATGSVYCWGADTEGELGQSTVGRDSNIPVAVALPGASSSGRD